MAKPIKPEEVITLKAKQMPDEMIEAINTLIAKHWDGREASIKQNEIVKLFVSLYKTSHPDARHIERMAYDEHWVDFEDIYRQEGWNVVYDKPGYNETYEAFFVFSKKK